MKVTISVFWDVMLCIILHEYPSIRRHIIQDRNFTTHSRQKLRTLIKDVCCVILQTFLSNITAINVEVDAIGTLER
jgi:hypothetical protein